MPYWDNATQEDWKSFNSNSEDFQISKFQGALIKTKILKEIYELPGNVNTILEVEQTKVLVSYRHYVAETNKQHCCIVAWDPIGDEADHAVCVYRNGKEVPNPGHPKCSDPDQFIE